MSLDREQLERFLNDEVTEEEMGERKPLKMILAESVDTVCQASVILGRAPSIYEIKRDRVHWFWLTDGDPLACVIGCDCCPGLTGIVVSRKATTKQKSKLRRLADRNHLDFELVG